MQIKTFSDLLSGVADLLKLTDVSPNAISLQLMVDEMPVSLMDNALASPDSFLFVCDFGAVPTHAERADVLRDLLSFNLLAVSSSAPVFCVNADTDHVLLTGKLQVEQTTASRLLHGLTEFAVQAREWRHNTVNIAGNGTAPSRSKTSRQHMLLHMADNITHS